MKPKMEHLWQTNLLALGDAPFIFNQRWILKRISIETKALTIRKP